MKKQLKDTEMGDKIYDPAQDKWRTKAEVFFMNKLQIEEIPHNRIILDAFEIIEMMQEYADQSSPQPQPGRFKKFSLLEENETVTSSDTIVQPQPGRGVEEKIVGKNYFAEDLIIEEFMERYDEKYHITLINSEGNCNLTEIGFKECLRRFAKILLQEYRTQSEGKDMYPKDDKLDYSEIYPLLKKGLRLAAIKKHYELFGGSLKDSKVICDELYRKMRQPDRDTDHAITGF